MIGRNARTLSLQPAATGLLIANLVVIAAAIASLLVARRAWTLREDALTALAEARLAASAGGAPGAAAVANRVRANAHAPISKLRAATMDRILLWGSLGALASAFFTWRLIAHSRALVQEAGPPFRRRS